MHAIEAIIQLRDDLSPTLEVANNNVTKFARKVERTGQKIRKTGQRIGYLGKDIVALTGPMVAFGTKSVYSFGQYEEAQKQAKEMTGATQKEMEGYLELADDMLDSRGANRRETMKMVSTLGMAGKSYKEINELMPILIDYTKAFGGAVEDNASKFMDATAALGIDEYEKFSDILAFTNKSFNIDGDDFLEGIINTKGAMNHVEMTAEEIGYLFGAYAEKGIKGSPAGTVVSSMINGIMKDSKQITKAWEKSGVERFTKSGDVRSLIDIAMDLKASGTFSKLPKNEQIALLSNMVGGSKNASTFSMLLDIVGDEKFEEYFEGVYGKGILASMSKELRGTLPHMQEEVKNHWEAFEETLGEALAPIAADTLDSLVDIIKEVNTALKDMDPEQIREMADHLLNFFKVGVSLIVVGSVIAAVGGLISNLSIIITFLGTAIGFLFSPLGLIIMLFGVLAAVIYENIDEIKEYFSGIGENLKKMAAGFKERIDEIKEWWSNLAENLRKTREARIKLHSKQFEEGMENARETWRKFKEFIKNPITGTVNLVKKGAGWVKGKIGQNYSGTSNWRGGPTTLHERGHEIVDLPGGTRVYPHDKSLEIARAEGRNESRGSSFKIQNLVETLIVREEADIDKIATLLARKLKDTEFNMA